MPASIARTDGPASSIDTSRHGAARNAGLGLAIVKSIMELHRGKVEVASRDGRTTFALHFPRGAER
ncbi:hypothetical protein BCEP4_220061 [Burkholderia cepacia]|nr:hypothetical protein BCEP4_220061 [Burkholderia cepacia]